MSYEPPKWLAWTDDEGQHIVVTEQVACYAIWFEEETLDLFVMDTEPWQRSVIHVHGADAIRLYEAISGETIAEAREESRRWIEEAKRTS